MLCPSSSSLLVVERLLFWVFWDQTRSSCSCCRSVGLLFCWLFTQLLIVCDVSFCSIRPVVLSRYLERQLASGLTFVCVAFLKGTACSLSAPAALYRCGVSLCESDVSAPCTDVSGADCVVPRCLLSPLYPGLFCVRVISYMLLKLSFISLCLHYCSYPHFSRYILLTLSFHTINLSSRFLSTQPSVAVLVLPSTLVTLCHLNLGVSVL